MKTLRMKKFEENPVLNITPDPVVLIIEDDKINRFIIQRYFEKWGITFDFATSGIDAISRANKKQYSLVITDINMPGINGFEVAIKIKATMGYAEVPIIALTAMLNNEVERLAFQSGIQKVISKPFDPDSFQVTIYNLLNKERII